MSAFAHAVAEDGGTANEIRTLIADDHPLLLAGIRRSLENSEGICIIGEARSGPEVLALIERRRPDVVLLDLRMPGVVGAECVAQIHERWPDIKTVVLSAEVDRATIDEALRAGASAYVIKTVTSTDLGAVIRQAISGGAIFHASTGAASQTSARDKSESPGCGLTTRERSIIAAVAAGKTTSVIGRELWVSEHTVKFHLTNIYRKLGVSNRAMAVKYALENGLAG